MKTMVVWRTVPGRYKPAVEQFLKTGGPVPDGVKRLARFSKIDGRGGCPTSACTRRRPVAS